MIKPEGFDEAKAERVGIYKKLPAGAYVCRIIEAKNTLSRSGREMLELNLDIAEVEYKDFFRDKYNKAKEKNDYAKWPCIYYQLVDGDAVGRFKGLLGIIKESNPTAKIGWETMESDLQNLIIGGVFREEEYIGNDGRKYTSVKCAWIIPVNDVETTTPPPPKKLTESPNYQTSGGNFGGYATNDDIPF